MISICRSFTFDSAHFLPLYDGKCANLHGHRWTLEVEISGLPNRTSGMVIDFVDLKKIVNEVIIEKHDHHCLNDIYVNPTAENILRGIRTELIYVFSPMKNIELSRLRLYESPDSYVEWNA